jgi:hypothetical protein
MFIVIVESVIKMTQSNIYSDMSRHILLRYNTIKHFLLNNIIFIYYAKSKKNIMSPLTKDLSRELVYNSLRRMGLKPLKMKRCNDGNHT